ncbi:hypothetical protein UFOVP181_293 [uncultured Caudovirales phage]|uniref:Uncharacterized protein n=1 Tax=uncultured Caudovirales phage TaxID=2100421 RepID=A0A6J7WHT5_9CAUD|nr:hypothetical protein UFOVP57_346 [uncultured Caudovirales phage]CAB5209036.1 hypothetical protein UFOVP181_293 [uncultured Caudovirales phage]
MSNFSKRENLDFYAVLVACLIALGIGIWIVVTTPRVTVTYDCRIAEISPDIPIPVKEKCRQLRATRN